MTPEGDRVGFIVPLSIMAFAATTESCWVGVGGLAPAAAWMTTPRDRANGGRVE